jgi:hypothetical protein
MSHDADFVRWLAQNRKAASLKMRTQHALFFHGGIPGLKAGDVLLPPMSTGTQHALINYSPGATPQDGRPQGKRRDAVYCSVNPFLSSRFAATYPNGSLYMVNPHLPMEPDPYLPLESLSVACAAATVIAVIVPEMSLRSQPKVIEEVLREREAGTMNALHHRALEAMRTTGLLDNGMTADDWAVAQAAPPSREEIAVLLRRAVMALSPKARDRYSNPARRTELTKQPVSRR